jgi:glutamyl-tRNA reductase
MDSMVLGETEITGQVKQAYQAAQQAKLTGTILNRLFQTALQTAKEVRTNTQIGRGSISVGSVAVELAEKIFDGDLSQKTVMIVGAGKMGEACLRHFAKKGAKSVLVCNRSLNKAEDLAKEFGGRAVAFDSLVKTLSEADIVVSSTGSPTTILHRQEVESTLAARHGRPLFLIDIAVPRDLDPAIQNINNVYLYNIDDLEKLMRENLRLREQELARCQAIIQEKTEAVLNKVSANLGNKQFWLGQALEKLSSQGPSGQKQQGCVSAAVQLQPTN